MTTINTDIDTAIATKGEISTDFDAALKSDWRIHTRIDALLDGPNQLEVDTNIDVLLSGPTRRWIVRLDAVISDSTWERIDEMLQQSLRTVDSTASGILLGAPYVVPVYRDLDGLIFPSLDALPVDIPMRFFTLINFFDIGADAVKILVCDEAMTHTVAVALSEYESRLTWDVSGGEMTPTEVGYDEDFWAKVDARSLFDLRLLDYQHILRGML